MRILRFIPLMAFVVLALAGCGNVRESLGLGRTAPDEFAVVDRPPLSMPPDYNLRPPMPGASRPQEVDPTTQASKALLGKASSSGKPASSAEQALLSQTGADKVDPNIRNTVDSEAINKVDASPHLLDSLLWWRKDDKANVVDAAAEAERLKQAKEKGQPANAGATPTIERQKSGWLGF